MLGEVLAKLGIIQAPPNWLKDILARDCRQVEFLSVDLELTSLDAQAGEILSVGFVPIIEGFISPGLGQHILISDNSGVGQSAIIHGIRDCDTQMGESLLHAIAKLKHEAQGRVMIFHHAGLDLSFLSKQDEWFDWQWALDTLRIEHARRQRQGLHVDNALRLHQCRERYNLPAYKAHNALTDALSTAELFLAQLAYMGGNEGMTLKEMMKLSR